MKIFTVLALLPLFSMTPAEAREEPVTRIAFGSCCKESRPAPIFDAVRALKPQVWIWMGDNIYGDSTDMTVLAEKYRIQATREPYASLAAECTVIGTWDDHDYGENDAGMEYPERKGSQQVWLDFLGLPEDHPRRNQQGVYGSHVFGPAGKQVKVILLDTRYHREQPGPEGDVLGEAQWEWLEQELVGSSAQVHLLVSSIQLVASDHRFEKWAEFPAAKQRLLKLLSRDDVPPVVVLSGDRHLAEISVESEQTPYPLYDITSSSLNVPLGPRDREVNERRVGKNYTGANFGSLTLDWTVQPVGLELVIHDEKGGHVRELTLQLER